MTYHRPELGHLETAVLSVVAAASEPVTVEQVKSQLDGEPAYTTVMSTLSRLTKKGALLRSLHGRAYRYHLAAPTTSIDDALTARSMRRLIEGPNRAAVLARFIAELDDDEEQMLTELLARPRTHPANS